MKIKGLAILGIFLVLGFLVLPQTVWAHQTVQIGDYGVEYGWVSEPAIANQANAVVINLTGKGGETNIDASTIQIQAILGSEKKMLSLQPLGENTPGQYVAPMTPTRPGIYTFHLSGAIGSTNFNNDVQPEEVHTADLVQFPMASTGDQASTSSLGMQGGLGIAGIVFGVMGIILGILALTRKPANKNL
jgi:hypothetical protein